MQPLERWDPPAPPAAELDAVIAVTGASPRMPLGPLTSLKVGGPAAGFLDINDATQLAVTLATLADHPQVPWMVLGKGSNLVISDAGFPGLVMRLGEGFRSVDVDDAEVSAGAAVPMPLLAATCATYGLTGLEFAAGVPATVGGSVRMNAGAHGSELAQHLVSITLATADGVRVVKVDELEFSYRHSNIPRNSVVVNARWRLQPGAVREVSAKVEEIKIWRRENQPIGERTCGSVFTNPPGTSAGALIESCGLKGHRRGSARISAMHANFIESDRGGTAEDVVELIAHAREVVLRECAVLLQPEAHLVGRFAADPPVPVEGRFDLA